MLLIRQYLWDWARDPVAPFTIERVDTAGSPAPLPSSADVAAAVDRATRWVEQSIDYWAAYVAASRDLLEHNTFTPPNTPSGGAPSIAYGGGCFDLGPDEALLIEHDAPDAHYWNWSVHQLHWFDSGAWDERLMSCNGHQAHVDADGRVRIVVAPTDPGAPNWLDTQGKPVGMCVYRYVGARTKPVPAARVVPLTDAPIRAARRSPGRQRRRAARPARRPVPRRAAPLELRRRALDATARAGLARPAERARRRGGRTRAPGRPRSRRAPRDRAREHRPRRLRR